LSVAIDEIVQGKVTFTFDAAEKTKKELAAEAADAEAAEARAEKADPANFLEEASA